MDKYELKQLEEISVLIDDLQKCFIEGDGYKRTPSVREWRAAVRMVHQLRLTTCELHGYAVACRQYNIVSIKERLNIEQGDSQCKKGVYVNDRA